jgi:hypothetical protein
MRLIDRLTSQDVKELIGKCWITHDGVWFAHTLLETNIQTANRLNKAAIKSLSSIEIKRFKKILDISDDPLNSFAALTDFFLNVSDLLIPAFMNVVITFSEPDMIHWAFNEKNCFAYNGVSMLGVVDGYECGPLFRIKCWLEELGIPYDMKPDVNLCVMPEKGVCSGRFKVHLSKGQEDSGTAAEGSINPKNQKEI